MRVLNYRKYVRGIRFLLFVSLSTFAVLGTSQVHADQSGKSHADADNTKQNESIQNNRETTAENQGNSKADRELAANIRAAIVEVNSISTNGHNVKIIVNKGIVELKGPVKSADERSQIEQIARKIAGTTMVKSTLEIAR